MTEEEAKTKWCPHARGINENGGNRAAYGSAGDGHVSDEYAEDMAMKFPCIGSACMAWRHSPVFLPWVNEKGETVEREGRSYTDFFCGLAGKP